MSIIDKPFNVNGVWYALLENAEDIKTPILIKLSNNGKSRLQKTNYSGRFRRNYR